MHLWLTHAQAKQIVTQARAQSPHEACGLIGGRDGRAVEVVLIDNIAATPTTHYELAPKQQAEAMMGFHKRGLDLIAIYHSHPNDPPVPSQTDVRSATYPDAAYLIVGLKNDHADLAAWRLRPPDVDRVPLHIGDDTPHDDITTAGFTGSQQLALWIAVAVAFAIVVIYAIYLLPPAPPIPTPSG